jgi:hypothetical protein
MMSPTFRIVVAVAVAAVSSTFGLEGSLHLCEIRSKTMEHVLNDMVGPNTKDLVLNFSWQVPVSQVPGNPRKLNGIFMPDFDDKFRSGLDLQPSSIVQLQAISIRHGDGFRKIEQDIFSLISSQTNAAAVTRVKIERESACQLFRWPLPGGAMNRSAMHRHSQYMKYR